MKPKRRVRKERSWTDGSILVPFGLLLAFSPDDLPVFPSPIGVRPTLQAAASRPRCASPERCAFIGCKCGGNVPPPAA